MARSRSLKSLLSKTWYLKVLTWSQEKLDRDVKEDKLDAARTFELIREIRNTLVPGLRLTVDLPEMHASGKCSMLGKCPMFDLQVWIEQANGVSRIHHTFFQEPSMSPLVFRLWRHLQIISSCWELRYGHLDTFNIKIRPLFKEI